MLFRSKVDKSEKIYCRTYLSAVELTFAAGSAAEMQAGQDGSYDGGDGGGGSSGGGDGGAGAGAGGSSPGVVYWVEVDGALTTTMCSDQNGDGSVDEATECCEDLDYNGMCDNTQSMDVPIDPPDFDPLTDQAVEHFQEPERAPFDLSLYTESDFATEEECFSTDRAKATRNVWR